MPPAFGPREHSAIAVLANELAAMLTTAIIRTHADELNVDPGGSNKADMLRGLLSTVHVTPKLQKDRSTLLMSLVMEAHARALAKKCEFHQATLDSILGASRDLGWDDRELRQKAWRKAIIAPPAPSSGPAVAAHPSSQPVGAHSAPRRHETAIAEIAQLLTDASVSPQERGHRLEVIPMGVLQVESLRPRRNVRVEGEELDLTFELSGVHYIVECKWLSAPVGDGDLSRLTHKVRTRPVGVRGVFLSMSGYVHNIETLAERGGQQQCIGFTSQHWMSVLEGRRSWTDLVLNGWRSASVNRKFIAPL